MYKNNGYVAKWRAKAEARFWRENSEELQEEAEERLAVQGKSERKARKKREREKWWKGARFRVESLEERKDKRKLFNRLKSRNEVSTTKEKRKGLY